MSVKWVRNTKNRLERRDPTSSDPIRLLSLKPFNMGDQQQNPSPKSLKDRFYPARTAQPSCIVLPQAQGNNFELKSQYITMLPHFHGLTSEDAYLFLREFEEVCVLIKIQQLSDDAVKLRFITFALKDQAKKWLYGLPTNSITSWE